MSKVNRDIYSAYNIDWHKKISKKEVLFQRVANQRDNVGKIEGVFPIKNQDLSSFIL